MSESHWNGEINGDWSYIYFIVPSCFSFVTAVVILAALKSSDYYRIPFYQYYAIHSVIDIIYAASWFPGPRYHTSGKLCEAQEYVFQFATLCKLINAALVVGSAYTLLKTKKLSSGWTRGTFILSYFSVLLCVIFSASFNSAVLFCPFEHDNFDLDTLRRSDLKAERITYFVAYIVPLLTITIMVTIFFVRVILISRLSYPEKVRKKYFIINFFARYMIYGLILVYIFVTPMFVYYGILLEFGISVKILAKIGASLMSSTGFVIGIIYFICVKKYHKLYVDVATADDKSSQNETINPLGEVMYSEYSQHASNAQFLRMTFFSEDITDTDDKTILSAQAPELEFRITSNFVRSENNLVHG